jgi:uncharacterized protein
LVNFGLPLERKRDNSHFWGHFSISCVTAKEPLNPLTEEDLLKITGFIWLEDIVEKLSQKHGVQREEVREVFTNRPHFRFVEKGHRRGDNVYAALGRIDAGRYVIVFFVYKRDGRALILSARAMTESEWRRYEQK